jgi:energy-coupling factor transporter ATP-binding protein EcfA2
MTGDLDSVTGFEIMSLVEKLNREHGTTVVYVTHDPRMAKYAHRTIQLRDGKIFAENGNGQDNPANAIKPGDLVIDDDGKLIVDRGSKQPCRGAAHSAQFFANCANEH